jgi:hypothetical protein
VCVCVCACVRFICLLAVLSVFAALYGPLLPEINEMDGWFRAPNNMAPSYLANERC